MKNLKIEIYVTDKKESTIKIPVGILRVASEIFPSKYQFCLDRNEISLSEILEAASRPGVSGYLIEMEDHKNNERIVISVD